MGALRRSWLWVLFSVAGCPSAPELGAPADLLSVDAGADAAAADLRPNMDLARPSFPTAPVPANLSQTGLYSDPATFTIAADVLEFQPRYPLWSDGAVKRRFVRIPAGKKIDTSDMDHWQIPVGTRLWKEFSVAGKRIETRMIERLGPGSFDFVFAAYKWDDAGTQDATFVKYGGQSVNGTTHDIPAQNDCTSCHGYLPERILGLSALQLSHSLPGATLSSLAAAGLLSVAPAPAGYAPPGDATAQNALGYLHGNCAPCHNPTGVPFLVPYSLFLRVGDSTVSATDAYRTTARVPVERFSNPDYPLRLLPGMSASSALLYRMTIRGTVEQMPPLASKKMDPTGTDAVKAWIDALN